MDALLNNRLNLEEPEAPEESGASPQKMDGNVVAPNDFSPRKVAPSDPQRNLHDRSRNAVP